MTYHVRSFMAFKRDELGHDPNHRIVCSNDPILCTCVHIGMANKVHIGSFHFLCIKKNQFLFSKCQDWVFYEGSTENTLQNYTNLILNNSRTHFMYISPFLCVYEALH
jgi:hypothetical protein